ncbi:MAG: alpha/beta fold hydrolase [Elusimicrobiota bacterium]|jgi:pimeloyl-ACP methyl ester carboxylesterase
MILAAVLALLACAAQAAPTPFPVRKGAAQPPVPPVAAVKSTETAKPVVRRPIRQLPGEEVQFKTKDGWTITGNYFESDQDRPTVMLLHDAAGRRQDWLPLASLLAKEGVGFLAWDMRGHGQSQNPPPEQPAQWNKFVVNKAYNEWDNMREDVAAAAAFLDEKGIPKEEIMIGGSDAGANIGLKYAAVHPEITAVFLLSPAINYKEVFAVNALRAYGERPILIVTAMDDRRFATEAGLLFGFAKQSAGEARAGLLQVEKKHGTKMFAAQKDLPQKLMEWILNPAPPELPVPAAAAAAPAESSDGLPTEEELDDSNVQQGAAR